MNFPEIYAQNPKFTTGHTFRENRTLYIYIYIYIHIYMLYIYIYIYIYILESLNTQWAQCINSGLVMFYLKRAGHTFWIKSNT